MKKVCVITLSCNPKILEEYYNKSISQVVNFFEDNDEYEVSFIVFEQGFSLKINDKVVVIRDDTHYKKGYVISEIRDYFTDLIVKSHNPDYILFTDDDFKFREKSGESLYYNLKYMDRHESVGLINFKMTNKDCSDESIYEPMNPTFIYMRGGILVRTSAYKGWSLEGFPGCRYYEESILATKIYQEGYRVLSSSTDIIHRTYSEGLGHQIEKEYEDDFSKLTDGGRQQLCASGLVICQTKDGKPNYRVPCKLSEKLKEDHADNFNEKFLNSTLISP